MRPSMVRIRIESDCTEISPYSPLGTTSVVTFRETVESRISSVIGSMFGTRIPYSPSPDRKPIRNTSLTISTSRTTVGTSEKSSFAICVKSLISDANVSRWRILICERFRNCDRRGSWLAATGKRSPISTIHSSSPGRLSVEIALTTFQTS